MRTRSASTPAAPPCPPGSTRSRGGARGGPRRLRRRHAGRPRRAPLRPSLRAGGPAPGGGARGRGDRRLPHPDQVFTYAVLLPALAAAHAADTVSRLRSGDAGPRGGAGRSAGDSRRQRLLARRSGPPAWRETTAGGAVDQAWTPSSTASSAASCAPSRRRGSPTRRRPSRHGRPSQGSGGLVRAWASSRTRGALGPLSPPAGGSANTGVAVELLARRCWRNVAIPCCRTGAPVSGAASATPLPWARRSTA